MGAAEGQRLGQILLALGPGVGLAGVHLQHHLPGVPLRGQQLQHPVGLLVAVLGGLGSLAFGYPFLTSGYTTLDLPGIASLSLASAMVFDAGVYMVVFCSTLLMLSTTGTVHHRGQAGHAVARESA